MGHVTRGHGIAAIIFGILEILFGTMIIIIGFVLAAKIDNPALTPYWAGFVYLLPGIIGVAAGAAKSNGCMIAFMVLNIIIFVLLGVGSILLFIGISLYSVMLTDINKCVSYGSTCTCTYEGTNYPFAASCESIVTSLMPALWAVGICCLISALVTLAASILGCISSCCTTAPLTGNLVVQQQQQPGFPPVYLQQNAPPQYMDKNAAI